MNKLLQFDFKHQLKVNYKSNNNCAEYGCEQDGTCRCTQITDTSVANVKVDDICKIIYDSYFDNSKSTKRSNKIDEILHGVDEGINRYTIDRILRINKIWQDDRWEIHIYDGYYGQEIDVVFLTNKFADKIFQQIEKAFSILNFNDRVRFLLELEYGKILPMLQESSFRLITLNRNQIILPSLSHAELVESKNIEYYYPNRYDLIRGVVKKDGTNFKLIDGYHRVLAVSSGFLKVIEAYE